MNGSSTGWRMVLKGQKGKERKKRGRRINARDASRGDTFLIINAADVRAEGARSLIAQSRVESGAPGATALTMASCRSNRRTGEREREKGTDGTERRTINAKYLLKSLINRLLAGVDIPYEWAFR